MYVQHDWTYPLAALSSPVVQLCWVSRDSRPPCNDLAWRSGILGPSRQSRRQTRRTRTREQVESLHRRFYRGSIVVCPSHRPGHERRWCTCLLSMLNKRWSDDDIINCSEFSIGRQDYTTYHRNLPEDCKRSVPDSISQWLMVIRTTQILKQIL